VQVRALDDVRVLADLADEAKDEATAIEAAGLLTTIEEAVGKMEFARMLSGPYDRQGAIVSINAGAGGTESQDWAEMLQRMYTRWVARRGYKSEILDLQPGDEAGIKSVTLGVTGEWASVRALGSKGDGELLGSIGLCSPVSRSSRSPSAEVPRWSRARRSSVSSPQMKASSHKSIWPVGRRGDNSALSSAL